MNKHQKLAYEATDLILIQDIEYGILANNNAKRAIHSSITSGTFTLNHSYIGEKMTIVRDIDKWLYYYVEEAQLRSQGGNLSMLLMQRLGDALNSAKSLFKN